jgi:hypothetical protein
MDILLLNVQDLAITRVAPIQLSNPIQTQTIDPEFSHIYMYTSQFLKAWAQAIPKEKLALFGKRLEWIQDVLLHQTFEILFIWNRPPMEPELCIQYKDKDEPTLNVSLTPRLLLFKDIKHERKEIAFPTTWS